MAKNDWDGVCECEHKYSKHDPKGRTHNVAAGKCSECHCTFFSLPGKTARETFARVLSMEVPSARRTSGINEARIRRIMVAADSAPNTSEAALVLIRELCEAIIGEEI